MSLDPRVQRLLDRQEIVDVLHRYCRGCSRMDEELLRSVYHEDGVHTTIAFSGVRDEFVAWYRSLRADIESTDFFLTTESVDLDGDTAHVESYYLCVVVPGGTATKSIYGGRYVDRFERRDGAWRIAVRVVVGEWSSTLEGAAAGGPEAWFREIARRDRGDVSYERPLQVRPPAPLA